MYVVKCKKVLTYASTLSSSHVENSTGVPRNLTPTLGIQTRCETLALEPYQVPTSLLQKDSSSGLLYYCPSVGLSPWTYM